MILDDPFRNNPESSTSLLAFDLDGEVLFVDDGPSVSPIEGAVAGASRASNSPLHELVQRSLHACQVRHGYAEGRSSADAPSERHTKSGPALAVRVMINSNTK
ncbi:hypothetical protein D3C81_658950 [compost metagenome]|jgi:hypothetical protein